MHAGDIGAYISSYRGSMENQMDNKRECEIETGFIGIHGLRVWGFSGRVRGASYVVKHLG